METLSATSTRTRKKTRIAVVITIVLLVGGVGMAAFAQNIAIKGTTTGEGNAFFLSSVGIGTSSPTSKLDVVGRVRLRKGSDSSAGTWLNNGSADVGLIGDSGGSGIGLWGNTGAGWSLLMNTSSGNVGIGQGPGGYKLEVNGDIRANAWMRTSGNAGWYSESYGGGWWMTDPTWIRTYGGKNVFMENQLLVNGSVSSHGDLPLYAAWGVYGTGDGGAAIYNDNGNYKKLMVVGNNSGGGAREVGVWDNLTVNGNLTVSGTISGAHAMSCTTATCYSGGAGGTCTAYCPSGYSATGGGFDTYGLEDSQQLSSRPSGDNGWTCYSSRHGLTCYAQCCR